MDFFSNLRQTFDYDEAVANSHEVRLTNCTVSTSWDESVKRSSKKINEAFTEDDRDDLVDNLCDALDLIEKVLQKKKYLSGPAYNATKSAQEYVSTAIDKVSSMKIEKEDK